MRLPIRGVSRADLQTQFDELRAADVDWRGGRAAVYVFDPGEDVREVVADTYRQFISENGLGPAAFPSLARMESEVVEMTLELLNGPAGSVGSMTSGGTESIFLATKTCRDWSLAERGEAGIEGTPKLQIIAPRTAHPAFDKAAQILGMEVVRVPVRSDLRADSAAMEAKINERTVMLVGSAPCFPFGLIDPIDEINDLAERSNLWLHVDACVGGYFAPFVRMNGTDLPPYDFGLSAVASMSADTHKYGYAAKGASTVMYRDEARYGHQVFHFSDWPCRAMTTPTLAGTRPGGAIAAAWAVMNYLGESGYRSRAKTVVELRERVEAGVVALGCTVHGVPALGLVSFGHQQLDIMAVGEGMRVKGWVSSRTEDPDGIHLMLSPGHAPVIEPYLADLAECLDDVAAGRQQRSSAQTRYA